MRYVRRALSLLLLLLVAGAPLPGEELRLPNREDSLRLAVIGDTGTGGTEQYDIARRMVDYYAKFRFEMVLMLGDNMYGGQTPADFVKKFERPYKLLLDAGVKFYASLGNHDDRAQKFYKPFNMNGDTYYTFKAPKADVRFFVLESDYVDRRQLDWVERELKASNERWKICYFHHPLYSSGARHGSDMSLRSVLEPLFLKYGVSVVFAGHEHFYERIRPQKGITYFTEGGSAKLRRGNIRSGDLTAAGFDQDNTFMLVEIAGDDMHFQTISRAGKIVDAGVVHVNETTTQ